MLRLNGATLTSKDGLNACTGSRSHTFIAHIRAADTVLSLNRLTFRGGVAADSALWCAAGGRRAGARRPSGRILFDALQQNAGALRL